jgi:hypothetical protein
LIWRDVHGTTPGMIKRLALIAAVLAAPLAAQDDPAANVSEERLRADIDTLVAFGTRHTLSEQDNPTRGIGAAVDWGLNQFRTISEGCGNCLEVVAPERMVSGNRIPEPVRLRNAVAIQRGTERPNEVVIVQAHIDSRASEALDWKSDAPGANDDGSGTVLVLEAARMLSTREYPSTIIYALLSGEEQGLYGGRLLADWVREQGFTVKAVLNNDIVGGSCGSDGYCDDKAVRVFSEGLRADSTDDLRAAQRRFGGENDSPSRNLSRWIDGLADTYDGGIDVRQIWRTDRMGRGGDQIPFLDAGLPAVRITVAVEDYEHQHQDLRTENGVVYGDTPDEMDFAYLAKVTQLNVRALHGLAMAPMPPKVTADAAVKTFTDVTWKPVSGANSWRVWTRETDAASWGEKPKRTLNDPEFSGCQEVTRDSVCAAPSYTSGTRFERLRGDDWIFGVAACDGAFCSPVSSAVPGGAFEPVAKADEK